MRIGQTNPSLVSEQHRTHVLILFITLITGAFTDEDVIRAPLGGSATFNLKVTGDMKVSLAEWSRCPDQKVFVFSPSHGLTIVNNSYAGRLFAKSNHSIVLEKLQESDFVTYCYKLSTFPQGSLQGQINLVKRTENVIISGLPMTVIISAGCGMGLIVLFGIIAGVVCYKKRRSNPALNPVQHKDQNKAKSTRTQSEEELQNDDSNYLSLT
ncbi:hypothetical protein DPX16_23042 [Anabarilius grahami]|uniref:Immunoglobulin V-set domain-containing protein n=1 Tax=Anabarilius grahami TaxID=495550 RepID=A0A3N0XHG8_ANAGA|nr:hypothetical protein DPX16_23042 [Anabarilius grahami]